MKKTKKNTEQITNNEFIHLKVVQPVEDYEVK